MKNKFLTCLLLAFSFMIVTQSISFAMKMAPLIRMDKACADKAMEANRNSVPGFNFAEEWKKCGTTIQSLRDQGMSATCEKACYDAEQNASKACSDEYQKHQDSEKAAKCFATVTKNKDDCYFACLPQKK